MNTERERLYRAIYATIESGARDERTRDALLLELATYQRERVAPYRRYYDHRVGARSIDAVAQVPALPTDAFRFARIASRPEHQDVRMFRSSGTTSSERSQHAFQDLSLYALAAERAAREALFPDFRERLLCILAPREEELPESSLSYMLARFGEWFASDVHYAWPLDAAHVRDLSERLRAAERSGTEVALLGTSFAFVHALDALGSTRFALSATSRLMQTGGYKGRSRELAPAELRAQLSATFGLEEARIVAEYGMTELSSQLYETTLRAALQGQDVPRRLTWPGWVRVSVVDPESLAPLPDGQEGLIRIDDLANLDSVAFIQTADVGILDEHGLTLLGRASEAVARGCSITADQLLGAQP